MNIQELLGWIAYLGKKIGPRFSAQKRYNIAHRLARLSRAVCPLPWKAVADNLAVITAATGQPSDVGRVFENFSNTVVDFLFPDDVHIRMEGRESAEEILRQGFGALILTTHLGHWELGGKVLSDWGWPVTAIYQPYRSKILRRFFQEERAPHLSYLMVGQGAALGASKVLKDKKILAMLGDRPFGETGLPVRMFGQEIRLPKGPYLLAARHRTPILPAFVIRTARGQYLGRIEKPLWPEGTSPEKIADLAQKAARVMERTIGQYPEQWFRFDRVWERA
ncbi:MAG TPA: lysophospholipid acyltransferase family protein [Elusimicrobiota bacterium]|nr:lysophospholipid acyltransferase family protein [Elusimicrobiota bacterium]